MSEPKIDLDAIFNELEGVKKNRAWQPTPEQIEILKRGRPDVSFAKLAQIINKHYGTKLSDGAVKYYCDQNGIS